MITSSRIPDADADATQIRSVEGKRKPWATPHVIKSEIQTDTWKPNYVTDFTTEGPPS